MKIIDIALNGLKLNSRNRINFAMILLLPVVMIFILGYAMKPTFQMESGIQKFQVLYVNEDKGFAGKAFDEFIDTAASKFIRPVDGKAGTVRDEVSSGKFAVAIVVPGNFSDAVQNNGNVSIEVIGSGKDTIKESYVRSLVSSFADSMNLQNGIAEVASKYGLKDSSVLSGTEQTSKNLGSNFIVSKKIDYSASSGLSSYQYFSVSMLLFFLMSLGTGLGTSILSERADGIYSRINSYPVNKYEYLGGRMASNMVMAVFQILTIILVSRFAFNVRWGGNIPGLIITLLLVMVLSSSIGMIFSSIMESPKVLSSVMTIVIWIIVFAGGGFSPIPGLDKISRFTFYRWGFDSIAAFMTGSSFSEAGVSLSALSVFTLLALIAGLILYDRRAQNE